MAAKPTAPKAAAPARREGEPSYWLLKSEPKTYSWDDLIRDGETRWDGVRNNQAAIYLRAMRAGDLALFYHSNEGLAAVGVVEVTHEAYPDPSDPSGRYVAVDVAPRAALAKPVSLAAMKAEPALAGMALFRLFRISVAPLTADEWRTILAMSR